MKERIKIIAKNATITKIVKEEIKKYGIYADLNHIDTSDVTDMAHLFSYSKFNGDISKWDVSNVRNMSLMFYRSAFNGDISKWNVSNVKDMQSMFYESSFNGDISKWNVSNVKDMSEMFSYSNFNGNLSKWDVSGVKDMYGMFENCWFNGDISNWNVLNVKNMSYMFYGSQFNQDISKWDVSNVENFVCMFGYSEFNQDIRKWHISSQALTNDMFYGNSKIKDCYKELIINGHRYNHQLYNDLKNGCFDHFRVDFNDRNYHIKRTHPNTNTTIQIDKLLSDFDKNIKEVLNKNKEFPNNITFLEYDLPLIVMTLIKNGFENINFEINEDEKSVLIYFCDGDEEPKIALKAEILDEVNYKLKTINI